MAGGHDQQMVGNNKPAIVFGDELFFVIVGLALLAVFFQSVGILH